LSECYGLRRDKKSPVTGSHPSTLYGDPAVSSMSSAMGATYDVKPGVPVKQMSVSLTGTVKSLKLTAALVPTHLDVVESLLELWRVNLRIPNRSYQHRRRVSVQGSLRTVGLMNPTGLFPTAIRASLMPVIRDPTTGDEHDVPNTRPNTPSICRKGQRRALLQQRGPLTPIT
jgi:hypothetical protein